MKSMKLLKGPSLPLWTQENQYLPFFNELAHGIARFFMSFMVEKVFMLLDSRFQHP